MADETLFIQHFKEEARSLDYYLTKMSGYQALKKSFGMPQDDIIGEMKKSNLRGRGGVLFPSNPQNQNT
jgi:NADH-quinone oxidoreductase subunit F